MGEDLGLFALNGQKPQTMGTMETDVMTGQEFKQMVERMRPRLMQMGREFFGSDTEAEEVVQETWLRAWNVRDKVTLTLKIDYLNGIGGKELYLPTGPRAYIGFIFCH